MSVHDPLLQRLKSEEHEHTHTRTYTHTYIHIHTHTHTHTYTQGGPINYPTRDGITIRERDTMKRAHKKKQVFIHKNKIKANVKQFIKDTEKLGSDTPRPPTTQRRYLVLEANDSFILNNLNDSIATNGALREIGFQ